MAILINSAEGGTDGVTVSNGNSGGSSGDAIDTINLNGGDVEYDTAQAMHGTKSFLFLPASGAVTELRWNVTDTTSLLFSFYVRMDTLPASGSVPTLCQIRNSSTTVGAIQVTTSSRFRVQASGSNVFTGSSNLSADTWYRCEIRVVRGTTTSDGQIEFAYYLSDSLTPVETFSDLSSNTGTTDLTNARVGRCSSATGVTDVASFWADSLQLFSGSDVGSLGNPWEAQKIPLTTTRTSDTEVSVDWTHPTDAPAGVSIIRCDGTQSNDGLGNAPSDDDYDPTTLAGDTTIATGLDGGDTPYADTGLTPGVFTYWVVRTSP